MRGMPGLRSAPGIVGILMSLLLITGSAWWIQLVAIAQPVPEAYVDVRSGDTVAALSRRVHEAGITSSPVSLQRYWQLRRGGTLHEGRYALKGVANMEGLFRVLAEAAPMTVRVTIPEGYTVRQIAMRMEEQAGIPATSFLAAARDSDGVLLEGRLFPDTYDVLYAGDAAEVVERMLKRFAGVKPSGWASAAQRHGLSEMQMVTVASIIEREVRFDEDRALVASVIFNRLEDGMLLQMDATLGYVLPSHDGFYTYAELKNPSPYNTYVHAGLPPTPICNPGLASLKAAVQAPATGYLYFLARPDGRCVFARTYAEHAQNIRTYLSGGN